MLPFDFAQGKNRSSALRFLELVKAANRIYPDRVGLVMSVEGPLL